MVKRHKRKKESIYRRFFFSLMLVLILPIFVYSLFYMNYFQKHMKENVALHAKLSLQVVIDELARYEDEFWAMALQNSNLNLTEYAYLEKDYNATDICALLASEVGTHMYVDEIFFYHNGIPQRIFCQSGTYSSKYFKQYKGDGDNTFLLHEYLEKLDDDGWILYEENTLTGELGLIYVIHINSGKYSNYWIYHLDKMHLENLLEVEDAVTVLFNSSGKQLYPYKISAEESSGNFAGFSVEVVDESLRLARYYDENNLFQQVRHSSNVFLISIFLIMSLGGLLVAYLSSKNKKPIEELKLYCESKCQEIPDTLGGLEVFRFTVDQLEERMNLLSRRQKEERLLFRLLYEKNHNIASLKRELAESGMFCESNLYCAFILEIKNDMVSSVCNNMFLQVLFPEKYEVHLTEIVGQNIWGGVLGIKNSDLSDLFVCLEEITKKISENIGAEAYFYVGEKCEKTEEVHWSYIQALQLMKGAKKEGNGAVIFETRGIYKKVPFIYPELELSSLNKALMDADYHTVSLVTDVLIEIIRDNQEEDTIYIMLCYDLIKIFSEANEELELEDHELTDMLVRKKMQSLNGAEEFIQFIDSIRNYFVNAMQEGKQETKTENIATKVITFIEQNSKNPDLSVSVVADKFDISISNLSHQFKAITNRNISEFILEKKFSYAKELILETDNSIYKIAEMIGYAQTASFIKRFKTYYGMTPMEYRKVSKKGNEKVVEAYETK